MAIVTKKDQTLKLLDRLMRDIQDGQVTVDDWCLSVQSEVTDVTNGWIVHSLTGRRILTITFEVPIQAKR